MITDVGRIEESTKSVTNLENVVWFTVNAASCNDTKYKRLPGHTKIREGPGKQATNLAEKTAAAISLCIYIYCIVGNFRENVCKF